MFKCEALIRFQRSVGWVNELHYWKLKINYFVRTSLNFESWSRKQPILIMKVIAWSKQTFVRLPFLPAHGCVCTCHRAWHVHMLIPFWLVRWNIEMLLIGTKRTCHVPLRTQMLCRCRHRRSVYVWWKTKGKEVKAALNAENLSHVLLSWIFILFIISKFILTQCFWLVRTEKKRPTCCLYECEIHHLAAGIELKRFTLQPSNLIQRMVYKYMYISKWINSVAW